MDVLFKRYFWLVTLTAIALCAVLGGRAAAHLIEQNWLLGVEESQGAIATAQRPRTLQPQQEKVHAKNDELIIKRNVFCSQCAPIVETTDKEEGSKDITKSSLPLDLVATMWVENEPD